MNEPPRSQVIRLVEAETGIPGPAGEHAAVIFKRDPLDIALSLPGYPRPQSPHTQDEIYVVVRGRGVLFHDGMRDPFQSGDPLFVAAGVEHQMEDISEDLAVWRVFYGPPGGEVPPGI